MLVSGVQHSGSTRPPFSPHGSGSRLHWQRQLGGVKWGASSVSLYKSDSADQPAPSALALMGHFLPSPYHVLLHPPPACTHPRIHTHAPTSQFLSQPNQMISFLDTRVSCSSSPFHSSPYSPCDYFPLFFSVLTLVPFASFVFLSLLFF